MKKVSLAAAGFALLTLAGCDRGNQDRLNEVDSNAASSEELNALADNAANLASEMKSSACRRRCDSMLKSQTSMFPTVC